MGKLEDMRVERVDGVDRPATGHRWVIVKSEETVEKDYAGTAKAALEALLKEEGVTFTKETADALHALAALLEMSVEFKSEDGEPGEADEAVEKTDDEAAEEESVEKTEESDDDAPLTKATLKAALEEILREEQEAELADEGVEVTKSAPKSKQSAEQDQVEKSGEKRRVAKGEGMFTNIIFGQD